MKALATACSTLCGLSVLTSLGLSDSFAAPQPYTVKASPSDISSGDSQLPSLRLRRGAEAVELVVMGTGPTPQLQQVMRAGLWEGVLMLSAPKGVLISPRRFSLPEAGIQSVTLDGGGSTFRLVVTPLSGIPLTKPVISSDGQNLILSFPLSAQIVSQTLRSPLTQPGTIPTASFAPPLQPRAVAPPLGDMAVGSMLLRNPSYLNISGPSITMALRNAPPRDALMSIAQLGGYGFVYVDDVSASTTSPSTQSGNVSNNANSSAVSSGARLVTISFRNETYARAINSVLLAAGLQGKLEGNMIFAGPNVLGKSFGPQMSKVYRLNQASAASAANYLASLGASISKVNIVTATTSSSDTAGTASASASNTSALTEAITNVETYGAALGPLRGLSGTTDSRLQTITLVGDANLVAVAENYLKQIDLRQRQVALSVKILDVTLDNITDIANSFAMRMGNTFIVNDNGQLAAAFGAFQPMSAGGFASQTPTTTTTTSSLDSNGETVANSQTDANSSSSTTSTIETGGAQPVDKSTTEDKSGVSTTQLDQNNQTSKSVNGSLVEGKSSVLPNPGLAYPQNQFYDFVKAKIQSSSTKVLAAPTLILSENPEPMRGGAEVGGATPSSGLAPATIGRPFANEAYVTVGVQEITSFNVVSGVQGSPNVCTPQFETAGLTFGARVNKIDDNGFVTFALSPTISATTPTSVTIPNCGTIKTLRIRRLDTGTVRVRDGQTLVLTGVISDADLQVVTKWPVLGDLPFVGQFFRASNGQRQKNELVILVSPRIIDDTQGGAFGYGYRPNTNDAQRMMSGSM